MATPAPAAAPGTEPPPPPTAPLPPPRRARTPTVLQMEAVECGAASLAIILGYYGRIVPLEELRTECGVSRDGSKASNVLKAARRYGLVAKGFKYEQVERLLDLTFPVILFWNMNHFLVLEGFSAKKFFINDPSFGPRAVDYDELDSSYSGVVLTFERGESFAPGGEKPSMLRSLKRRLADSQMALAYIALSALMLVVPGLLLPTFTRIFIDEFLIGNQVYLVKPMLWAMGLAALLQLSLTWLREHVLIRLETKLSLVHSSAFFTHIQRLPVPYFVQRYAGEIGSRVAINDRVANVIAAKLMTTAVDLGVLFFYLVLMLMYDVLLTFVIALLAAMNVVIVRAVQRARTDVNRRLLQDKGKLMGTAMNGLLMMETLKATGGESEFFARWSGYQAKALRGEQVLTALSETTTIVPQVIAPLSTMIVYLIGGLKVMSGSMTIGMVVAYQTLVGVFTKPIANLVSFAGLLQELEGDMNRLDDVLNYPPDPQYARVASDSDGASPVKLQGHVELREVTFGYSPLDAPLIRQLSIEIQPGQRVALVGGSGSGKSTVAKLVAGLYEPWEGQVLLDGADRTELPRPLVTNSLAVVDQEVFLFGGTVAENVTMWDRTLPTSRVASAARDAALADVIERRRGRYEAWIAEGGGNLSGGQRQRLEIARALVGEPTVLVLDEATSALDATTEAQIMENVRQRGCTCVIIAHRLSTIRDCDRIYVMSKGQIVQSGTHEDMKDAPGPYQELISVH